MKIFITLYLLFFAACSAILLSFPKEDIFLWINQRNSIAADNIFSAITYFGNGFMYLVVFIGLLFVKYRYALISAVSFALTSTVVQICKHLVFEDAKRPLLFFENTIDLHVVSGVDSLYYNSFPSGHTAAAFSIACMLTIFFKKSWVGALCFAIAILVGYSRIYLAQHFLSDVLFGSLIGVGISLLAYYLVSKTTWLNSKTRLYDVSVFILKHFLLFVICYVFLPFFYFG